MRYALLGNQIKNLGLANNCIHSDRCYAAAPHRLVMLALARRTDGSDMKYFDKRQNPFGSTVTDEVMESLFKELADQFGIRWLNSQGDHTLQNLWNRRDALSTNELYALAHAINRLNRIDDAWVSHQTKQIIEGDGNNQRGAFFELIGLDILMVPELYRVIPAHRNQAGIDATLAFPEGGNINLSLKNYSL